MRSLLRLLWALVQRVPKNVNVLYPPKQKRIRRALQEVQPELDELRADFDRRVERTIND